MEKQKGPTQSRAFSRLLLQLSAKHTGRIDDASGRQQPDGDQS
jgi:hypothetical protein